MPTIQLEEETLQRLNKVKKEMKAKNIDEAIQRLIAERKKMPASMFGSNPNLTSMAEEDEQ